jgi:hypothetical protein
MNKNFRLLWIVIFMALSFCGGSFSLAQESPLKVQVFVKEVARYGIDIRPIIETVIRIENISKEDVRFSEWSCSYQESFITDNTLVSPAAWDCHGNLVRTYILKPGTKLEWPLRLMIFSTEMDGKDVRFKVAYKAWRLKGEAKFPSPTAVETFEGAPFWSDEVKVHILPIKQ